MGGTPAEEEEEAEDDEDETPPAEGRGRTGTTAEGSSTIATGVATTAFGSLIQGGGGERQESLRRLYVQRREDEEERGKRTDEREVSICETGKRAEQCRGFTQSPL